MLKTLLSTILLIFSFCAYSTKTYVNVNATGANNGTSWADAFTSFDSTFTLDWDDRTDTIWVAKGIYMPAPGAAFMLTEAQKYFGGFEGWETEFSQRNWKNNITILQGNGGPVIANGNLSLTNACELDGFTIRGGTAQTINGGGIYTWGSPVIRNCTITGNTSAQSGGGLYFIQDSPVLINCIISGNTARNGGGIYCNGATPIVINCQITGNSATFGSGGGINIGSQAGGSFINCTIAGNWAYNTYGGIVIGQGAAATIKNCIVNRNKNLQIYKFATATATITNTIGYGGATNFDIDPQFVNPLTPAAIPNAGGDYHLQACSPAITAGNNTAISQATDLDGLPRIYNASVDIGAYEYQGLPGGSSLPTGNSTITKTIYAGATAISAPNTCTIIAKLLPTGGTALSGDVTTSVWIDGSVQSYNSQYYVQRHYDITPANNAATATAKVTLFFTQAEFDAFNVVNTVKLPTGPADAPGIANLKMLQFHGISPSGTPGTYSGSTVTIDPADAGIVWNSTLNAWEVGFDVTGFSGF